jgi:hypothetical protein
MKIICNLSSFLFFSFLSITIANAQMITGVWHGKIDKQNVEVKMVQQGDSISGTSYYYSSPTNYQRYGIKGFIDPDNSVVWWDDQLIDEKTKGLNLFRKKTPASSKAEFNCPGGGVMKLDGNVYRDEEQKRPDGDIHLQKTETSTFKDEWDFVIENYTVGANDPDIIDSISTIATTISEKTIVPPVEEKKPETPTVITEERVVKKQTPVTTVPIKSETKIPEIKAPTIEQKFVTREKVFTREIPITGDSIELRFYDNAEIDGDSISLFLNNRLLFQHIRLTDKAYTIRLSAKDLQENNELVMVAENLGAIPPNTSYMLAIVGNKRYDAQLASTEGSSAMIRLVKKASSYKP